MEETRIINLAGNQHNFALCSNLTRGPNTIWEPYAWGEFQDAYRKVAGKETSIVAATRGTGFSVPYDIKQVHGKGRGVFATTKIQKGTKVWEAQYRAEFSGEQEFMQFLSVLPFEAACDVIGWAYVIDKDYFDDDWDEDFLACDLDEGSLMNTVLEDDDEVAKVAECRYLSADLKGKLGCDQETITAVYAVEDIDAGEEITIDYGNWHVHGSLEWYDDLWEIAEYGEEEDSDDSDEL